MSSTEIETRKTDLNIHENTTKESTDIEAFLEEKLDVRKETDEQGYSRKIYKLQNQEFSFKGLHEIPIYPVIESSETILLGEDSKVLKELLPEGYLHYKTKGIKETSRDNTSEHFLVNKTLRGVLSLAVKFGSKDKEVHEVIGELDQDVYSRKALILIDKLLACNFSGEQGIEKKSTTDAEAIVLLSLLGDKEATEIVEEKLREFYDSFSDSIKGEEKVQEALEKGSLKKYCIVHATSFQPEEVPNGDLVVETTHDATGGLKLRNTVHTCISHRVQSHAYGSWDNKGVTIISSLEKAIKQNGSPGSLYPKDTFWERNPGEKFVFPDAILVKEGSLGMDQLIRINEETRKVEYKSKDLTIEDVKMLDLLYKKYLNSGLSINNIFDKIRLSINYMEEKDSLLKEKLISSWDLDALFLTSLDIEKETETGRLLDSFVEIAEKFGSESVYQAANEYIKEKFLHCMNSGVEDEESAINELSKQLANQLDAYLNSVLCEVAVCQAFEAFGFEYDDPFAADEDFFNEIYSFCKENNIGLDRHLDTANSRFIKIFENSFAGFSSYEDGKFNLVKAIGLLERLNELIPEMSMRSLRIMYNAGLLNARQD